MLSITKKNIGILKLITTNLMFKASLLQHAIMKKCEILANPKQPSCKRVCGCQQSHSEKEVKSNGG